MKTKELDYLMKKYAIAWEIIYMRRMMKKHKEETGDSLDFYLADYIDRRLENICVSCKNEKDIVRFIEDILYEFSDGEEYCELMRSKREEGNRQAISIYKLKCDAHNFKCVLD